MSTCVIIVCWPGMKWVFSSKMFHFSFNFLCKLIGGCLIWWGSQNLFVNIFFSPQRFGNKIGEGRYRGKALPTYVYLDCLKEAIRTIIDGSLRDYPNPETAAVSCLFSCQIHPSILIKFVVPFKQNANLIQIFTFILPLGVQGNLERPRPGKMAWRSIGPVRNKNERNWWWILSIIFLWSC